MKRILSILFILCLCTSAIFADEEGDEYDDGYEYQQNGPGDQFLKIELGGLFPLNFHGTLRPGFEANLGYYRFLTSNFGVGGEIVITDSFSIGGKPLYMIPVTAGCIYQFEISKFEIPLLFNIGLSTETWASMTYWPSLTVKGSAGLYYRMTESWSFGGSTTLFSITEFKNPSDKTGLFITAGLNARYHF